MFSLPVCKAVPNQFRLCQLFYKNSLRYHGFRHAYFSDNAKSLKPSGEDEKYFSQLYGQTRKTGTEIYVLPATEQTFAKTLPTSEDELSETSEMQSHNFTDISKNLNLNSENPALSTTVNTEFLNTIVPTLPPTFNLAAYAEQSEVLQKLVNLGVDLSRIEKKGPQISKRILSLDFEKNIQPYLQFLLSCGIAATDLGLFITRNPAIFDQNMEDLQVRINYLKSKAFHDKAIARILNRAPTFININTKYIDTRLGYFQKEYKLTGDEVRFLITKNSKIATVKFFHLQNCAFAVREVMGFNEQEVRTLLLSKPKLWLMNIEMFKSRFNYLHNEIGFSHKILTENPSIFLFRQFLVQQRHTYLKTLNRDQYDPKQPNYVSVQALVAGNDVQFCQEVAKTNVTDFNEFLKTM